MPKQVRQRYAEIVGRHWRERFGMDAVVRVAYRSVTSLLALCIHKEQAKYLARHPALPQKSPWGPGLYQ